MGSRTLFGWYWQKPIISAEKNAMRETPHDTYSQTHPEGTEKRSTSNDCAGRRCELHSILSVVIKSGKGGGSDDCCYTYHCGHSGWRGVEEDFGPVAR